MKKLALSYQEWVKSEGQSEEWGAKALITDKVIRRIPEWKTHMARILSKTLTKALIESGQRPSKTHLHKERDITLRCNEYISHLEAVQGDHPLEYLGVAYFAWQEEQTKRLNWENKSLWQYIKHSWRRRFSLIK